ncbi:chromosome segregation protein SMC [Fredinandcohnia quinoae]|uniref:Chromosome partition protein Smc n=1 Tax=Fredinandcohnia quinoae TaxID=2918902 RepID=A0AAW5DTV7_9BACI|nr:chromosome segregation protein SMC [Fredinandcohnia sp. SECRCQ15]MCH1623813.1 chromosome segregation protein SMC [Fredinandcohnia sp. SECRCQ15]
MFLKRLDIVGFKSFAERIAVDFVPGVTAVVGPNGSGKSNITDGIRWVLGEQSAKSLRGTKMEDIIFVGSDSRKALNVAEVTLTLDNDDHFLPIDYNEVSVTRRVYRSGESEFLINKQSCRLKDIVDLFMDSGLGREAFSIISQGKVEEILSSKSEERRSIFEEAAGVLKYKSRKKKAEYKLAETQENLNRVNDILHELEIQKEPLQIQASIAKDYLEKKEELEQIEVGLTVYEIEDLHEKWEQLSKLVEQHKEKELGLNTILQKKEAQIEEIRGQMDAADEAVNELQQVLLRTSEELEKLEGRKEVLKERKKNAVQNRSLLESSIKELNVKISSLSETKTQELEKLKSLINEVQQLKDELTNKQTLLESFDQNIEEKIENIKSDYIELLNKQATYRNEIVYLKDQEQQQERKASRLDESNQKYVLERTAIQDEKLSLQTKLSVIEEEINKQIISFRDVQKKLENSKTNYQKKESTLYQAYQYLQQTKSRKEMLEEMQDDYAGFFQGVKEVLKARNESLSGIEGAIAELIHVPKEYETAIEIALGGATQHIVVDNEKSARDAIKYLKQNSFGRATFLPLNIIKERIISSGLLDSVKAHPSFIGVAADLISYKTEYQSVINNLLGTVIITSDLKGANELAKIIQHRYRLVTLDGDVVNPGGSMTGGAVKQKSNSLLSRGRELETVTEKLAEMEEKTNDLEQHIKKLKSSISENEDILERLREVGEQLRLKEQSVKSEYREVVLKEQNVNEHLALYDQEKQLFGSDQEKIIVRLTELEKELANIEEQLNRMDDTLNQLQLQKNDQQSSRESILTEITDRKVILAGKKQSVENQQEKVHRLEEEYLQLTSKYTEANDDLSLLNNEMTSNHSGEQELEEAARKKADDKDETIQLISSRREKRLQLQITLEDIERELKEDKRQYKQLVDILKDEEVQVNRLDVELENRLNHLREEYLLTYEAAKQKYPLQMEITDARKKVKLIKLAIEELGTVNIGAIDEFDRIFDRFTFLTEQKDDLQVAKDTLYKVIGEMDVEMKKRFETTFTSIRSHFESVFQALFGGGRADLLLTDPNDLLNTGVDIVAQPPGKKLQNLSLLSGGERALTAIALLFSILKVRPVPFCVLDEVEAALDEANVYRFAKYLKQFSKETQFIVITHRKGTMEEADVLYGVTMQESGVSKLVSVRLEESKDFVTSN